MLLDSNIIIYAAQPEHHELRRLIAEQTPAVSAISYVEVLGYHRLTTQAREHFKAFFAAAPGAAFISSRIGSSGKSASSEKNYFGRCIGGCYCLSA